MKWGKIQLLRDIFHIEFRVPQTVTARIRGGWKKFRDLGSLLCKEGLSLKLRDILYKVYVRSVLSYRAKYWTVKVGDVKILESTEMIILRMA